MSAIVAWLYFAFNRIDTLSLFLSNSCYYTVMLKETIVRLALFLPPYLLSVWSYTRYLTFLFIFKRVKLIPASWGCMRTKWNHLCLVVTTAAVYQIFLSPSGHKAGLFLSPLMIMQFTWLILLSSEHLNFSLQHRHFTVFEMMFASLSRVLDVVKESLLIWMDM